MWREAENRYRQISFLRLYSLSTCAVVWHTTNKTVVECLSLSFALNFFFVKNKNNNKCNRMSHSDAGIFMQKNTSLSSFFAGPGQLYFVNVLRCIIYPVVINIIFTEIFFIKKTKLFRHFLTQFYLHFCQFTLNGKQESQATKKCWIYLE